MKVLHVVAGMDPGMGGVSQAVRTMISGLNEFHVHNEVASMDAADATFLKTDSFVTHALGPGKGPWCYASRLRPWLMQHISRFDFVLIHGLWLYHSFAVHKVIEYFKKLEKSSYLNSNQFPKCLIMPHGMLDPYFQRAPDRRLKALRNQIYWQLIERFTINQADGMLFTCEEERRLAKEPFSSYNPVKEAVISLGVDKPPVYDISMSEAFYQKCPAVRNYPYLLFLSRIHPKKGLDILINAYLSLKAEGLELPKLVIAGPGADTEYGRAIQKLAKRSEDIFFIDMLSGNTKYGAFYGCDAFILPSHQENFGIAVVEALACSKPVIISDQVNIWREINTEQAGIISSDTVSGVREQLKDWVAMTVKEKQVMGKNARKLFLKSFSVTEVSRRMIAELNTGTY